MENSINIEVNIGGAKELLTFIEETKEGKFTTEKPDISNIIYRRVSIQAVQLYNESTSDIILYGTSY